MLYCIATENFLSLLLLAGNNAGFFLPKHPLIAQRIDLLATTDETRLPALGLNNQAAG